MASVDLSIERPRAGNPFRVYPVATLQSLDDVYPWTVDTPGIESLRVELESFKKYFDQRKEGGPIVPLGLAVRGPAGSGKTHLILYARSWLDRNMTFRRARAMKLRNSAQL